MKTIKYTQIYLLAAIAFLTVNMNAQSGSIGGGLSYGSEIEEPGINLRASGALSSGIMFGADFNYFFPGDDGSFDVDVYGVNGNLSFLIHAGEVVYLYPLVGINYTSVRTEFVGFTETRSEVGANVGGGFGFNFGAISPFLEYKYVISNYDQNVLTVGVLFNLSRQ